MGLVLASADVVTEDAAAINWWGVGAFALALVTVALVFVLIPAARGVVRGKDRRISTSKFQGAMWTIVVIWALFALLYAWAIARFGHDLIGTNGPEGAWAALSK